MVVNSVTLATVVKYIPAWIPGAAFKRKALHAKKLVWEAPMDDRLEVSMDQARLLVNNMDAGGTWINPRGTGDAKYGGFDGGSGGCKCEWVNWV